MDNLTLDVQCALSHFLQRKNLGVHVHASSYLVVWKRDNCEPAQPVLSFTTFTSHHLNREIYLFCYCLRMENLHFCRFLLTDYGRALAEKFGFSDDIDENGCVFPKVYYQLLRKTTRRGRLVAGCFIQYGRHFFCLRTPYFGVESGHFLSFLQFEPTRLMVSLQLPFTVFYLNNPG